MKKPFVVSILCLVAVLSLSSQAIHVVNTTNDVDDGVCNAAHCSLREAIRLSNTNIGPDSIRFNIPGPGPHVINLTSALPGIIDSLLVIDGTTQPGNNPMAGLIRIDGSGLPPGPNHGLVIYTRKTEIYGLQIQNFPADGIQFFRDIVDDSHLSNLIIGAPGKGNVIINNAAYGIEGPVDRNVRIQSNYVGTDLQFNPGLGNGWDGIFAAVLTGQNVVIGGSRALGEQNYVGSNYFSGIRLLIDDPAQLVPGFRITGNVIGTDASGTLDLGNLGFVFGNVQVGGGMLITGDAPLTIGGPGDLGNIIAFNYTGIYIGDGDRRTILENSFYCNTNKGVHLANNANAGILPPAILCRQGSLLAGVADAGALVDIYIHNPTGCPDVLCQGRDWIGQTTADAGGAWSFSALPWPGVEFTAIARDASGNSSEFGACVLNPTVTATNTGPYCYGDSILLFAMLDTVVANVTYQWFGPDGYTSNTQNPTDATMEGTYLVVADILGCGADSAYTDVIVYPLATDTIRDFCFGDQWVINGNVYDHTNALGEEILPGAAQNGCDSLVVFRLRFNESILGRILSTRPRACFGDTIDYWFDLQLGGGAGAGPYDVIYTTGLGPPDTLYGIFGGHTQSIVVTSNVYFEVLDISTNLSICTPIIGTSDSIIVSQLDISPTVTDYGGFGVSCFGASDGMIILNVTDGVGTVNYQWSRPALSGNTAAELSAGIYAVTVTDEANCRIEFDTVIIQPNLFEAIIRTELSTCPGVDDGAIFIDALLGARGPVEYALDGGPFLPLTALPMEIPDMPSGLVNLTLVDGAGCISDHMVFVPSGLTPSLDLGSTQSIFSGDSVLLNFNTSLIPAQIQWSPAHLVSCTTCPTTYAFPAESQYITVTVSDVLGCTATDSVLVMVLIPKQVYIPTIFSPNGDQINDMFYLQGNTFAQEVEYMIIADRWGNVVFERSNFPLNDPGNGWDGTLNGRPMFPAVFTYLLRVRFSDGDIVPYSGTVTLIR